MKCSKITVLAWRTLTARAVSLSLHRLCLYMKNFQNINFENGYSNK